MSRSSGCGVPVRVPWQSLPRPQPSARRPAGREAPPAQRPIDRLCDPAPCVHTASHTNPHSRISALPAAALSSAAENPRPLRRHSHDDQGRRRRIRHQVSARRSQQMRHARAERQSRSEHRQPSSAFQQIGAQRRRSQPRRQQQPQQQHRKRLQRQRNRREPQRQCDVRADGNQQRCPPESLRRCATRSRRQNSRSLKPAASKFGFPRCVP